ncbi:DNA cytosine methyltransferase [Phyllobacterium ifriqiyense]|uniref:DNA cytosine methyltransferase n=1 Tax=Phyllobacterium ifriqiyense TaxID=314238 RepID=UPI003393FA4B
MRYGSVCSGIEAASVAWAPLNWSPAFFAEIEKFPSAVLAHHYGSNMPGDDHSKNGVPNYGDMTKFQEWPDHAIDLLVGGTPCQSFSVAGLRKGLDDPRGNLMLTYLAIARRYQPKWLVWENVPGVLSSNGGRDFGTFIRGLEECGYHAAWRVLDAQYVRVDGFGRAVPQRRRRVFVVGYLGDWRRAAAVLFERESLSGNSAPVRNARKSFTYTVGDSATGELLGGFDYENNAHGPEDATGPLLKGSPTGGGRPLPAIVINRDWPADVAPTLDAAYADKMGLEDQHVFNQRGGKFVPAPIAFNSREDPEVTYDRTGSLGASSPQAQAVAWSIMPQNSGKDYKARQVDVAQPIMAGGPVGGNQGGDYIQQQWAVRRLTPMECERLQGFPDGYTLIPVRKALAADGPRYKALGNSMAINCMRWIGQQIAKVEAMSAMELAA